MEDKQENKKACCDHDKVGLCENCNRNAAMPSHPCPYREEIGGDSETLCNCCAACQYDCAMDI